MYISFQAARATCERVRCQKVFEVFELLNTLHDVASQLSKQSDPFSSSLKLVIIDSLPAVILPILGGKQKHGKLETSLDISNKNRLAFIPHIEARTKWPPFSVFMKIIGHIGHFRWLGPNVWREISQIWIEYIKPIGQMSDESWKFFRYTAFCRQYYQMHFIINKFEFPFRIH